MNKNELEYWSKIDTKICVLYCEFNIILTQMYDGIHSMIDFYYGGFRGGWNSHDIWIYFYVVVVSAVIMKNMSKKR